MPTDVITEKELAEIAGWPVQVVRAFRDHGGMAEKVPAESTGKFRKRSRFQRRKAMLFLSRAASIGGLKLLHASGKEKR